MDTALIDELIFEIKADYQFPPYLPKDVVERSIKKCAAVLTQLNPAADFANDEIARGLLKEYVHYDLHHRFEEFQQNYQSDILAWQLSQEVTHESE